KSIRRKTFNFLCVIRILCKLNIRKADKSALTYEKIGNLTLNEQRSAQWGKFIFFSLGQDLGARH
ncbi:hypothetical protein BED40_08020, partial [Enterococcus faecium]